MKTISHSIVETEHFAKEFLNIIAKIKEDKKGKKVDKSKSSCVVGLYGDLGSGKTAFTQVVAKLFGIEENVTSPTYVIEKIYPLAQATQRVDSTPVNSLLTPFKHLIHIDAYRIEKSEELIHLGWKNIVNDPENIILIEWPERVLDIMPTDHIKLRFTFINETTREIELVD